MSSQVFKFIDQETERCTSELQAALDDFTNWLKYGRKNITPPPLPSPPPPQMNHEDPLSPSSDECASVGSPLVSGNDEYNIVGIDDIMFTELKQHTNIQSSQDLYKTKNKENNNNNQRLAFSNKNTNDLWTSQCDTKVRSYKLPDIPFTGCIYKNTLSKTQQLSVPEMIDEGLLVYKFLDEFESHFSRTNLNIEDHWYGLLEILFKDVRNKHIELYVWFKKRLFEGLPWSAAKAIMKHQIGFESCFSKKKIKEALFTYYRQRPRESFKVFYDRFETYVTACKALSLYSDHVLIHHFISNVHADLYQYMEECLYKQLALKGKARTLPFPEDEYNSLSLGGDMVNVLSKVPSSWEEFGMTIVSAHLRKLCTISKRTSCSTNRAKVPKRKIQSDLGSGTKKAIKFT
ncbi:hypothetical protein HPULCUR_008615 [Helicostylum pulchrum]|uniref:Retrotransposon gag domain-containing protein n=1 Tax=Helicostylum pulchrum TaxID=562976 RepID=A0ABP9Y8Q5_9FUNG